jgi:hypothetical protein
MYLCDRRKELVWLMAGGQPMHRRGVQIRGHLLEPRAGSIYRVHDGALELEGGFRLDLNRKPGWKPEPLRSSGLLNQYELVQSLSAIMTSLHRLPSPRGFGRILPELIQMAGGGAAPLDIYSEFPVLHMAWPSIREFIAAVSAQDYAGALNSASRLIGLGEGLTPSGDDFVGGMFFSFETLAKVFEQSSEFNRHDLESFLAYAKRSTNIISYTILADHVRGHGSEFLHQFLNALLCGESQDRLQDLLSRAVSLGNSTGWDILAGALTGMFIWIEENAALKVQVT